IRRICKTAGFTTIYVTHDQKEALSIADRIAVLNEGRLCQVGTPGELYHNPATAFVADFIGQTHLLPGRIARRAVPGIEVETKAGRFIARPRAGDDGQSLTEQVIISIRPEQMRLVPAGSGGAGSTGSTGGAGGTGGTGARVNRLVGRP